MTDESPLTRGAFSLSPIFQNRAYWLKLCKHVLRLSMIVLWMKRSVRHELQKHFVFHLPCKGGFEGMPEAVLRATQRGDTSTLVHTLEMFVGNVGDDEPLINPKGTKRQHFGKVFVDKDNIVP